MAYFYSTLKCFENLKETNWQHHLTEKSSLTLKNEILEKEKKSFISEQKSGVKQKATFKANLNGSL